MESKVKFENNSFDVISLFAALNVMIAHTCTYVIGGGLDLI